MNEKLILRLRFNKADLTAEEYISLNKKILKELNESDAYFSDFGNWDLQTNKPIIFQNDFSDFEEKVFKQIYDAEIAYINDNSRDKEFQKNSISPFGFRNSYTPNSKVESNANITIDVSPTSSTRSSYLTIEFPSEQINQFSNFQYCIALLKKMTLVVNALDGCVITKPFFHKVNKKGCEPPIGWITYMGEKSVIKYLPQQVTIESFANGFIFIFSHECPTSQNTQAIETAIEIRDILAPVIM